MATNNSFTTWKKEFVQMPLRKLSLGQMTQCKISLGQMSKVPMSHLFIFYHKVLNVNFSVSTIRQKKIFVCLPSL